MASEVELKLEVTPAMLRVLSKAAWLKRLAQGQVERQRLVSVYFDTASHALKREGLSLRVRCDGDRQVQTVKTVEAGSYRRREWEGEIDGERPQRRLARGTALAPFTSKSNWRKLQPLFETDIRRTILPVQCGESLIEVALDHGKVKSGKAARPIDEIELELKAGDPADLARLAVRLAKATQAWLGLFSKAERGYALTEARPDEAVHAGPLMLDPAMSAAEGFRAIGFSCLHHLAANCAAVAAGDSEGVHQMRVAVRRLRAALSLFKPLIEGPQLETVKQDLKWLGGELGPARDFDVFVTKSLVPLEEEAPAGLKSLERDLKNRRDKGFARARRLVEGRRYRQVLLSTGLWLAGGDWAVDGDVLRRNLRERKLIDMAQEILAMRSARLLKKVKKLDRMDGPHRHKLRIAAKKLRYGVEFFASLFRHKGARKRFAAGLEELQDALGRLNDIHVHEDFARQTVDGKKRLPRGAYALGVVTGKESAAVKPCLAAAQKAGARLRGLEPFWR